MKFFTCSQFGFGCLDRSNVRQHNPLQKRVVGALRSIGVELNPSRDSVIVTQTQFTGFGFARNHQLMTMTVKNILIVWHNEFTKSGHGDRTTSDAEQIADCQIGFQNQPLGVQRAIPNRGVMIESEIH